ncbi:cytochrome b [Pectobacterium brasiliense]|uniref:cytochrome b n=1 Tax=Pectobacterium brasiliense TaxID=180957 RepID=UPI001968F04E|nr:cytochrome b [Pectobacterium brasiliense]MBN3068264.1 cytochrome b [Pectobacterium brasiliense]MBN3245145.1 cytochrome b [Pectobacterium brasiliense]
MKKTYASSQIIFHWLVFIMVVITYAAMEFKGLTPKGSSARAMMALVNYTAGFGVLLLMMVRIVLKYIHSTPEIVPPPPRWQMVAAKTVHGILYVIFLALPLLGLFSLYFGQVEWSFLGITMPVAGVLNKDIQHNLKALHELIANAGYFIIGLHAAAALFHHYIVRDNTLNRMLPLRKGRMPE